jgi:hypothetical protein
VLELRRIGELEDYGDAISPEVKAREEKLAAELATRNQKGAP